MSDYIDREELLKAVDTWDKFGCDADTKLVPVRDCYVPYVHYDDIIHSIKGMPSADVREDVKGEWIEWKGRNGRYHGIPICSNCNTGFPIDAKDYNFCPNCGADMRGEENDSKGTNKST